LTAATREPDLGPQLSRPHWVTFLTLSEHDVGQLPARYVPFLAADDLGPLRHSLSAILYPAGMRQAMIRSLPVGTDLSLAGPESRPWWSTNHARVWNDLRDWDVLSVPRQANLLALLNCLSEQRLALPLIRTLATDRSRKEDEGWLVFEAARALIRIQPSNQSARRVLDSLRNTNSDPLLRTLAAIHLAAMMTRVDGEHSAAECVMMEVKLQDVVARADSEFTLRIASSRWHRLMALICTRKGDFKAVERNVELAFEHAEYATAIAEGSPGHRYVSLVANENTKMVLESHVLAAGKRGLPAQLRKSAMSLIELDPYDSYTWRTVAIASSDAKMKLSCVAALGGLSVLGGPGIPDVANRAVAAPTSDGGEDECLANDLLTKVGDIY